MNRYGNRAENEESERAQNKELLAKDLPMHGERWGSGLFILPFWHEH